MDPLLMGGLAVGALLVLVGFGIPVAISMASVAFVGMWMVAGLPSAFGMFRTLPYEIGSQYTFVVVPMFVLMGALASAAGITSELYTATYRFLAQVRGSLYYATILASAGFAAVSGSTVVSAAVFTRMALPEMISFGCNRSLGAGCIAAAGTFAALIPPSIAMVIYGILTEESIGALLMAGVIPGILTAAVYVLGLRVLLQVKPEWAPSVTRVFTWAEKLESLKGIWALILLVVLVLGTIYTGLMPPSAAGTIGAMGALLICLGRRKLGNGVFWTALKQSASVTSVLFAIIIGGLLFSRLLLLTGFVTELSDFVSNSGFTAPQFLLFVVVMYFVLGMFIDTLSMMVMTIPFIYPVVIALGLDPVWFGVIMIKMMEISAITPPVGLNLYAVLGAAEGRVGSREVFLGVLPFVVLELIVLGLLLAFPQISLWLPSAML